MTHDHEVITGRFHLGVPSDLPHARKQIKYHAPTIKHTMLSVVILFIKTEHSFLQTRKYTRAQARTHTQSRSLTGQLIVSPVLRTLKSCGPRP